MNILVIGSGGREHAIVWCVAKSKNIDKIYCAPGNAGTSSIAENIDIQIDDIKGLLEFAKKKAIGLTIVGPEIPLVNGIVDIFEAEGLKIFGPNKDASQMEGSKAFTKNLFEKYNIPTADFREFVDSDKAKNYIKENMIYPIVIKADGLAAGKGVIIAETQAQALDAVQDIMNNKKFGAAGTKIVIEEFLEGEEASILAFTDGKTVLALPPSQDHKRIFDNDLGPNTGGMGAYAPAPLITPLLAERIKNEILLPTVAALKSEGITYKGILYAGIMMTKNGPKVLEYNVRFGDPETQAVLPLLKTDLVELCLASAEGRLKDIKLELEDKAAITVVLASKGYPGDYEKNIEITGLDSFKNMNDVMAFHAGTTRQNNKVVTSGGRVINITAVAKDIKSAIEKVYNNIDKIHFEGVYYRKDVGKKGLR
ncbi:MAG: phosphoribosylamine--glycine ligase [bacterium]